MSNECTTDNHIGRGGEIEAVKNITVTYSILNGHNTTKYICCTYFIEKTAETQKLDRLPRLPRDK